MIYNLQYYIYILLFIFINIWIYRKKEFFKSNDTFYNFIVYNICITSLKVLLISQYCES